jgi:putative redox protein
MATKWARVRYIGPDLRLEAETGSGHRLVLDTLAGGGGPGPSELLLVAQAGCTAMDVASILAKKRQSVTSYEVEVTGVARDEPPPHVYTRIDVVHRVTGPAVEEVAVRRAIELSATKYCTVTGQLASGVAEIHHRYVIRRGEGDEATIEGEVVVTGPGESPDALGQRAAGSAA